MMTQLMKTYGVNNEKHHDKNDDNRNNDKI